MFHLLVGLGLEGAGLGLGTAGLDHMTVLNMIYETHDTINTISHSETQLASYRTPNMQQNLTT